MKFNAVTRTHTHTYTHVGPCLSLFASVERKGFKGESDRVVAAARREKKKKKVRGACLLPFACSTHKRTAHEERRRQKRRRKKRGENQPCLALLGCAEHSADLHACTTTSLLFLLLFVKRHAKVDLLTGFERKVMFLLAVLRRGHFCPFEPLVTPISVMPRQQLAFCGCVARVRNRTSVYFGVSHAQRKRARHKTFLLPIEPS